jgi:hypothetical protein
MWGFFIILVFIHLKTYNMKAKGQVNYSSKELKQIKLAMRYNKTMPKPLSTSRLAKIVSKELGRSYTGVYYKMLGMKPATNTKRTTVKGTRVVAQKNPAPSSVTLGRPTKIEISNDGMTFYF